mgnify:CR=1 FL=1
MGSDDGKPYSFPVNPVAEKTLLPINPSFASAPEPPDPLAPPATTIFPAPAPPSFFSVLASA